MKGRLENLKLQLDQDSLSLFIIFGSVVAWIPNFTGCFEKYHVKRNNAEVSKLLYLLAPSTCARKPKVPGSSPAASYVQR